MGIAAIPIETINQRLPANSLLTAIEYLEGRYVAPSGAMRRMVKCKCSCGKFKDCVVADLIKGNPLSCGHIKRGAKPGGKRESGMKYKKRKVIKLN